MGKVLLADQGVCLARVRAGLAWHYNRYQSGQTQNDRLRYARAEEEV